jgi:hypothetical protein
MKLFFTTIIIILSFILIISVLCHCSQSPRLAEGYQDKSMFQTPLTNSQLTLILTDIITTINKHENTLHIIEPSYNVHPISFNQSDADIIDSNEIIFNPSIWFSKMNDLIAILENQNAILTKIYPQYSNTHYMYSENDLKSLKTGSSLTELRNKLIQECTQPPTPLTCSPEAIDAQIASYKKLIEDPNPTIDPASNDAMTVKAMITQLYVAKSNIQTQNNLPNDKTCSPILSKQDANAIYKANYLNILNNIINTQDIAIEKIRSIIEKQIINTFMPSSSSPLDMNSIPTETI